MISPERRRLTSRRTGTPGEEPEPRPSIRRHERSVGSTAEQHAGKVAVTMARTRSRAPGPSRDAWPVRPDQTSRYEARSGTPLQMISDLDLGQTTEPQVHGSRFPGKRGDRVARQGVRGHPPDPVGPYGERAIERTQILAVPFPAACWQQPFVLASRSVVGSAHVRRPISAVRRGCICPLGDPARSAELALLCGMQPAERGGRPIGNRVGQGHHRRRGDR